VLTDSPGPDSKLKKQKRNEIVIKESDERMTM
jgi:hypothetical protein